MPRKGPKEPKFSLSVLLYALIGERVIVDLRNDVSFCGVLDEVDGSMNMQLIDVARTAVDGTVDRFDLMFLSGRVVRYVHIPDSIDVGKAIDEQIQARVLAARKYRQRKYVPRQPAGRGLAPLVPEPDPEAAGSSSSAPAPARSPPAAQPQPPPPGD
eukprot:tig00000459_g1088.t1